MELKEGTPGALVKSYGAAEQVHVPRPFDTLPISQSSYGRNSAVDVPARYSADATMDNIFENARYATLDKNGTLHIDSTSKNMSCIVLDATHLAVENVDYSMYQIDNYKDLIYSITVSGSTSMTLNGLDKLFRDVLVKERFNYLIELDISYVAVSQYALDALCKYIDPVTAGYCPLRRLIATRCCLGSKGVISLVKALKQNTVIEELFLSGNAATDSAVVFLVQFLSFRGNGITTLGLGDNQLTVHGMNDLSAIVGNHHKLVNLQLNGNSIGDNGVDHILGAMGGRLNFDSLNLNSCGVIDCFWANNLCNLLSLSSLFLSHNGIDDSGLQMLASGLRATCTLRYLDLSYNLFGKTPGSGLSLGSLGSIIKLNRMLTVLVLSGNEMLQASWCSVAVGLFENESLLRLDVTYCELTLASAEALCRALEVNQTVSIDMRYNDLPDILLCNPRQYEVTENGSMGISPKSLYSNVSAVAHLTSQEWRISRVQEINESSAVGAIVDQHSIVEEVVLRKISKPERSTPSSPVRSSEEIKTAAESSSSKQLSESVTNVKILTVSYGHISTILGVVRVEDDTTYTQAKELVKPLVRAYLGNTLRGVKTSDDLSVADEKDYGLTARPCRNYAEDFVLLTPAGQTIEHNLARVSNASVWRVVMILKNMFSFYYNFFHSIGPKCLGGGRG